VIRKGSVRLFVASVVALALLSMSTAALASAAVTGAGSVIAGAVMPNWTNGFLIKEGITATYASVGVEAGLAKLDARSVDFAAADAPLSPEQAAACNGCAQIPWLLTGVDVAFRIPGVKSLNLSGTVIAEIYAGKITNWSDPKIAELNPNAKLPKLKITPVYSTEAGGQNWTFTSYLAKVGSKKSGGRTKVNFPVGVGAAGDAGVGGKIASTNGAIGYVTASYANALDLKTAAVENLAGNFERPEVATFEAAGASVKSVPASGLVDATDPSKTAAKAYPLAMFGYAVVPHAAPQKAFVQQFLNYAVGPGATLGEAFEIAPMPKAVKSAARRMIGAL
jgi:phosphate transport system substrate-binding protein